MSKVDCPRCSQDYVVNALVTPLQTAIKICAECDAFWWQDEPILKTNFKVYWVYIEENGYSCDWNLLDISGPVSLNE